MAKRNMNLPRKAVVVMVCASWLAGASEMMLGLVIAPIGQENATMFGTRIPRRANPRRVSMDSNRFVFVVGLISADWCVKC